MDSLVRKVKRLLLRAFPGSRITLENDEYGLGGKIISPTFRRMDSLERVQRIGAALYGHLTPEEERRYVLIMGLTPEEEMARASLDEIPNGTRRAPRPSGRRP